MKINVAMLKDEENMNDYQPTLDIFSPMPGGLTYTMSDIEETLATFNSTTMVVVDQEETMDVAAKYEAAAPPPPLEFYPISRLGPPERQLFAGKLNFHVEINSHHTHRKKYLYSHRLNRIYVNMGIDFPVQFRWDASPTNGPMYVRATVVFSDESQQEKRVERCTQHTHDSSNNGLDHSIVKNVLRSSRQMDTQGVFYCGIAERADSWLSVVVEFPTHGACGHAYQFVCKNSCCSGINRRAIEIVFELEDHTGKIYGRQSVGARACSCPRRDLHRDEGDGAGAEKRKAEPAPKQTKRIKQAMPTLTAPEQESTDVYTVPVLEVVGSRALIAGLGAMLAVMEHDAASHRHDPATLEKYTTRIAKIKTAIEQHKKPPQ